MIGSIVAGRFKIEKKAGSGGMGTVYRAHDVVDGSKVALKILASEEVRDAERFAQEAAILATLSHPAIVRYVAHGVTGEQHFLAMEWLDGENLDVRADKEPLGLLQVLGVLRRTTQALSYAHERDIIHRDIKPENLFLPGGRIEGLKLLDFGVARLTQAKRKLTQTGVFLGTPAYVAPEVVMGSRAADRRIDFYSLGCVAFRCLTGRTPFESDDVGALLTKIMIEEPPSVKKYAPAVPDAMADLVARLLKKDPGERPADGVELLALLDKLEDLPDVRPEYRKRRASVSLTLSEKRMGCLVMAGPPGGERLPRPSDRPQDTAVVVERVGAAPDLVGLEAQLASTYNATVHSFPDGSYIVRLPPVGKAADLATRAAQAALLARRHTPDRPFVVVSAQVSVSDDSVGLGAMIDAAARMITDTPVGRIGLHDVVAALTDTRFLISRQGRQVFLEGDPTSITQTRHKLLGKATEFVGRSRELAGLTGMLTAGLEEGAAQAAVVMGPAGIGKSRLLQEFLTAAQRQAPNLKVLYAGADSLAAGSPFALLARLLRRHAGVVDGEPIEESRRKLGQCFGAEGGEAARRLVFLGELCRVPFPETQNEALRAARTNPQLMGDLMRRAFEDWLKAECDRHPLLLVLDDLHWGDAGTVAFVDTALRTLRDCSLLVLALGRPELRTSFPDLWASSRPLAIELGPLSKKAAEKLVREALGPAVEVATVAAIVARADGNPFYLEELVRAAREGRSEGLPDSILGMVHARLDAEGEVAKQILRAASIFGERFSRRGLAALLGGEAELPHLTEWVERLTARELISSHAEAQGSEGELSFTHALIRDAAYATLTEEDSVLGHQLAGEYLELGGCLDAMVLAQHFRRGNQPARAVRWYREAAEQALQASDLSGAISRAQIGLATLAALDTARRAEVPTDAAGALRLAQAEAHLWRAEFAQAVARGTEATAALRRGSELWFRALGQTVVGVAKQGKTEDLWVLAQDALKTECHAEAGNAQVVCLAWAASFLMMADRRGELDRLLARIGQLVKQLAHPDPEALAMVHQAQAASASMRGDQLACLEALEAAVAAFETAGDTRNVASLRSNIGFVVAELGMWERAEAVLREALADAQRMGLAELEAVVQHNLGRVLAMRGDLDGGERLERQAIDSFSRQGEPRLEGLARTYLAEIRLWAGAPADAETHANQALEVLRSSPAARVLALTVRAAAASAQARPQEALAMAQQANEELDALGAIEEGEAGVRLVYAECLAAMGRRPEALTVIEKACQRLRERAAGIADSDLRKRFLCDVPVHARALALATTWTGVLDVPRGGSHAAGN
jgi:tetratricopeptide (TPR) repeat protein